MDSLIHRYAAIVLLSVGLIADPVQSQVLPDNTLPTLVSSPDNRNFAISGGSQRGGNLFHSFSQFSVPTGGAAVFNNPGDVQNIFGRVTGGTVSNIDGLIQAGGGANLFLLNPNGVVFGPNSRLDIGGSFLGSTAEGVKFADGVMFGSGTGDLLTVSVPVGLQMGANPGAIQATGTGHRFTPMQILFPTPLNPRDPIANLQVRPGKTLALIGGDIGLNGAVLRSPSGHIELGAVESGSSVGLSPDALGWKFDYGQVSNFRNLTAGQRALLDSSGSPGGSMHLQGATIKLTDGSVGLIQTQGFQRPGRLQVDAIDRLELRVDNPMVLIPSGFIAMGTMDAATTSAVDITAPQLILSNGGTIANNHGGFGIGGSVTVRSAQYIHAIGAPDGQLRNAIGSTASGLAVSGNISVMTPDLQLRNRSEILSNTSGLGSAGSIRIDADDIQVGGVVADGISAYVGSAAIGRGNSGTVVINTRRLSVQDSARVESSTYGIGNAGDITVNASESIEVGGTSPITGKKSYIASSTELPLEIFRVLFELPPLPSGNAGVLSIKTPLLEIVDGGLVSVVNRGTGDGGRMRIEADRVVLNQGNITSSTVSGKGGNIQLDVGSLLSMRSGSQISAEAGANGDGGNITINSKLILGIENSDLIANAVKGRGGNITLTTEGVFGLKFRDRLTPDNDITASSEFGVNGTVQVNTIGVNPSSGLVELPVDTVDPSQKIATGCSTRGDSSFVATGRGGMPENPMQVAKIDRSWSDLRAIADTKLETKIAAAAPIEATALVTNAQGQIELMGEGAIASNPNGVSCSRQ